MQKANLVNNIKNELYKYPVIRQVTLSIASPFNIPLSMSGMADWVGKDSKDQTILTPISVDTDYRNIFHLELAEGRWFGLNTEQDHHSYLVNESAVAAFHLNQPYIGQYFSLLGDTGQVIGIVKDFHFRDYRQKIGPVVFYYKPEEAGAFFVQARGADMSKAIAKAGQTWALFFPSDPFEYHFLDEEFAKLYADDIRLSWLIGVFSAIAILISCLGLFGLVSFMAEQRTREIGIRKVLGASVLRIALMLSADYFVLILIALLVASPLAFWYMNKWLQGFVYRINLQWWLIPLAGVLTLLIALGTMSFQCIKAGRMNPVKNLRNE
jgi:putative ABC transport system permease protein